VKAVAVKKAQPKPVSKQAKKNPSPVKNTTTSKTPAKKKPLRPAKLRLQKKSGRDQSSKESSCGS